MFYQLRSGGRIHVDEVSGPSSTNDAVKQLFGAAGAGGEAGGQVVGTAASTSGALTLSPSGATRAVFLCTDLMSVNLRQGVAQVVVKPGRDVSLARVAPSLYEFRASHRAYGSTAHNGGSGARSTSSDGVVVVKGDIIATFQTHLDAWAYLQTFGGEVSLILNGMTGCSCAAVR